MKTISIALLLCVLTSGFAENNSPPAYKVYDIASITDEQYIIIVIKLDRMPQYNIYHLTQTKTLILDFYDTFLGKKSFKKIMTPPVKKTLIQQKTIEGSLSFTRIIFFLERLVEYQINEQENMIFVTLEKQVELKREEVIVADSNTLKVQDSLLVQEIEDTTTQTEVMKIQEIFQTENQVIVKEIQETQVPDAPAVPVVDSLAQITQDTASVTQDSSNKTDLLTLSAPPVADTQEQVPSLHESAVVIDTILPQKSTFLLKQCLVTETKNKLKFRFEFNGIDPQYLPDFFAGRCILTLLNTKIDSTTFQFIDSGYHSEIQFSQIHKDSADPGVEVSIVPHLKDYLHQIILEKNVLILEFGKKKGRAKLYTISSGIIGTGIGVAYYMIKAHEASAQKKGTNTLPINDLPPNPRR